MSKLGLSLLALLRVSRAGADQSCYGSEKTCSAAQEVESLEPIWKNHLPMMKVLDRRPDITILSWMPPLIRFDKLLTGEEAETIRTLALPKMVPSQASGLSCRSTWLNGREDSKDLMVRSIQERFFNLTGVPPENGEPLQVVQYDEGGSEAGAHTDFLPQQETEPAGARLATLLIYLSDVEEGGGTAFPALGITVQPRLGQALLWFNMDLPRQQHGRGEVDERLRHTGLPVVRGDKWVANWWLHPRDFLGPFFAGDLRRSEEPASEVSLGSVPITWTGPPPLQVYEEDPSATILSRDPLIVSFDSFLTEEEVMYVRELATPRMHKSTVGWNYEEDNYIRTSSTGWLNERKDYEDPILKQIDLRVQEKTGVPPENMESFQVLRYGPGELYQVHHDYVPEQEKLACGKRIATFYIYLNDVVKGGQTEFPQLELNVTGKLGKAVLWWNINLTMFAEGGSLDSPGIVDQRVTHMAHPPLEGEKWGTNRWLHARDFVTPYFGGQLR